MLDFIYTLFIAPLEFGMDKALSWGYELTGNWGWAIIVMSLIVNTVILPIYLKAEHWQEEERNIRKSFENDEAMIKRTFKGQERFAMITTMHRLAGYSPLLTLRSSIGLFLQIPFFFAAYHLLSHFEPLQGIAFLGLHDLAKPDELLKIGNFTINFMPILMTVINIASALIYTSNLSKRDKYQLYGMAALFLVLLYNAASGLVLYWTFNNIYSLCKNAVLVRIKPFSQKVINCKNKAPSYVWTLPLGISLPFIFLWSNNTFAYTSLSLIFCITVVTIVCVMCSILLKSLTKSFNLEKNKPFICTYGIVLGFSLCFFGLPIIMGVFYAQRWYLIWIVPLICSFLIYCFGFRFVNLLLISQLTLSVGLAAYNIGLDYEATQEINKKNSSYLIRFEKKPNIYLFFCESYQNLEVVKKLYGYSSDKFLQQMISSGMTIHNNVYANTPFTLGSLRDILTMTYHLRTIGNLDAFSSEREIISGSKNNLLFKTLKENGYETTFYTNGTDGFFTTKNKYLDHTDYNPSLSQVLLDPLVDSNYYIERFLGYFIQNTNNQKKLNDLEALKYFVNKQLPSGKPQFYLHYMLAAFHTPSNGTYNYTMKNSWLKNSGYPDRIKQANEIVLSITQYLRNVDPKAIIIFIGDHGPWRIRDFPFDFNEMQNNKPLLDGINESYQSVIDDYYHVFSAIFYPNDFYPLNNFSHVNLFPKLFRQLAPNSIKQIEQIEQKENFSIYQEHIMAINGQPQEHTLFWK